MDKEEKGNVSREVYNLEDNICKAQELIDVLVSKLNLVLKIQKSDKDNLCSAQVSDDWCPLSSQLHTQSYRVDEMVGALQDILNRIDL